jgi:hypothetical protein
MRAVNLAHAAGADRGTNFIRAELFARRQHFGSILYASLSVARRFSRRSADWSNFKPVELCMDFRVAPSSTHGQQGIKLSDYSAHLCQPTRTDLGT